MKRRIWFAAACAAALIIMAGTAALGAGENAAEGGRRRPPAARFRAAGGPRMALLGDDARAEIKRHVAALKEIRESIQALREKVRQAIKDGGKPADVLETFKPEAVKLARSLLSESATHHTNMARIADAAGDEGAEKLARLLLLPRRRHANARRGRRPLRRPQPGKNAAGPKEQNPFDE
ncbi:MAG: hypothetical protein R6V58_11880 [Planctomycetota bacterium]